MKRFAVWSCAFVFVIGSVNAQESAQTAAASATDPPPISQEELDQMLASIALYPDSLLSQILMAATYPLEIVQADRWVQANAGLTGSELTQALEAEDWDPSVKSLCNFPDVLKSLSDNLEWTTKIGDAFLADQAAVMNTVQNLRAKAKDEGNLKTTEQMTVTTEPATAPAPVGSTTTTTEVIVIESSDPEVIYVPSYDPVVVYGSWWYPSYPPPTYYYPPYYAPGAALIGFGTGLALGAAWGWAWGDCNWGGGDIDIDIDRNTNINRDIDRSKYKAEFENRGGRDGKGSFNHDASHRKGVEYRDQSAANRYGGTSRAEAVQSRDAYRGRADQGRADLARDTAAGRIDTSNLQRSGTSDRAGGGQFDRSGAGGGAGQFDRPSAGSGTGTRPSAGDRSAAGGGISSRPSTSDRSSYGGGASSFDRSSATRSSSSAFSGSSRGSGASFDSSRGSMSRSGGASRAGGMSRGGGGRGGGRR